MHSGDVMNDSTAHSDVENERIKGDITDSTWFVENQVLKVLKYSLPKGKGDADRI